MNSLKSLTKFHFRTLQINQKYQKQTLHQKWPNRFSSTCNQYCSSDKKDCFDINNVTLERGNQCHSGMVKSFLNTYFWPREPTVMGLWMPLRNSYLDTLTEKYSTSGDRLLAYETVPRTGERKLIGVGIGNKVPSWTANELEEWAHYTESLPEKNRMYFCAHCLRAPNLFKKFNCDYIYEVEIVSTSSEVAGNGVGLMILQRFLDDGFELRYPVIQVVAVSSYMANICDKAGMKKVWSMKYSDYVDERGQRVFYPRRPHFQVAVYIKQLDQKAIRRGEFKSSLKPVTKQ